MDSYANAAVATFESGQQSALTQWLKQIGTSKHMTLYLLSSAGAIIGEEVPPEPVKQISANLLKEELDDGLLKFGNVIVSHEILSTSGMAYRLVAVSDMPLAHYIEIPWAGLTLRLLIAIFISGLICYLLSIYLTRPLRSLQSAAKSIARGKLSTRVGQFKGHGRDEIAELIGEFDRMAAELESIIHSKQRLLQDISHELRSPLARLQIAIELGRKKVEGRAQNELDRMEMECLRLNDLIGEMIEFARLDTLTSQLEKTLINLPALLTEISSDANYEHSQNNPAVHLHCLEDCDLFLDKRLIYRAIENIIRNALRYASPNPQILVTLHSDALQPVVYIDIEDNGPGVPEDQLEKIFNPFYRVDPSREKKTGGYGLGLSIAQRAILLHHGTIHATNRHPKGLKVRITLPTLVAKEIN